MQLIKVLPQEKYEIVNKINIGVELRVIKIDGSNMILGDTNGVISIFDINKLKLSFK